MNEITGDFAHAVKLASEIVAIRGRIFPATSARVTLEAVLTDKAVVRGESKISKSRKPIEQVRLSPPDSQPLPETLEAIRSADLITLGPGSLYTSIIPNLLVNGIAEAIEQSGALKVYFVNLMWQPGETISFAASHHVEAIQRHAGRKLIDVIVINTTPISPALKRRYARDKVKPVENDIERLTSLGIKIVTSDLLGDSGQGKVRHNPEALAEVVVDLASRSRALQVKRGVLASKLKKAH